MADVSQPGDNCMTKNKSKKVTMQDVAAYAGVSYQTVSRVLNNTCNVSDATREKIKKAIAELKYVPNMLAQQLSKPDFKIVGLINVATNLSAPGAVACSLRTNALQHGYHFMMILLDSPDVDKLSQALDEMRAQLIHKIVINIPLNTDDASSLKERNSDLELLFLDVDPFCTVFNVTFNPHDGTRASIEHLRSLGHKRVLLLAGPEGIISSDLRLKSWKDGLSLNELECAGVLHGDWSARSGCDAVLNFINAGKTDFTAMLVANDQMALGVISALNRSGIKVPGDVSVIGYDDTDDSAFYLPPLTTVILDRELQCKVAIDKLLSEDESDKISAVLPSKFVARKSCAQRSTQKHDLSDIAAELRNLARQLENDKTLLNP